jgi:hypothetical protein
VVGCAVATLEHSALWRGWADSEIFEVMHADKVEVSWDGGKHSWLVRIEVGSEVLRRHCNQPRDWDEENLRSAAVQTVTDEGYEIDPSRISVIR